MIRSGGDEANEPDMVHLHSKRSGRAVPVLSGTSLAGAMRARALRIVNTLDISGRYSVDSLFGYRKPSQTDEGSSGQPKSRVPGRTSRSAESDKITASRLWVRECEIEQSINDQVHTRLKIDRFTGGAYPGALFSQQPVFANAPNSHDALGTHVTLHIDIDQPTDADVGLLLLLLKDAWTGDLPVGGESSVGRGRLFGHNATLNYKGHSYTFTTGQDPDRAIVIQYPEAAPAPQTFVDALTGKDEKDASSAKGADHV